jgi:hypothetical protein
MKLETIPEPDLEFAKDRYICPRIGIASFDVYDSLREIRRDKINIGAVGTDKGLEKLRQWLERCKQPIPARADTLQRYLFPSFPGFHPDYGFKASLVISSEGFKSIPSEEVRKIVKDEEDSRSHKVLKALELYLKSIEFLARNRRAIDVIMCVLPNELYDAITKEEREDAEESVTKHEDELPDIEYNFRRALKAESLRLEKPLQLVRELSLTDQASQDAATRAWNFCTAIYYKTNQTVPWKLVTDQNEPRVCYVGVGFFRSRDKQATHTSLAQIFDELGNNVILRGGLAYEEKSDRRPHLERDQAETLLGRAIDDYILANESQPARLVLHKTSLYTDKEREGFMRACESHSIKRVDLVTFLDTTDRALRTGRYPPLRGTHITFDEKTHLLYTRGSVPFYRTYAGLYIPQPLDIRIDSADSSSEKICREILGLTKMNWNSARFDGKYPITLRCAQKVGEIMKYLPADYEPKPETISYGYYM